MAEKSYLWTTGGAGDGASTYTRVDWLYIAEVVSASRGPGIGTNYFNRFWGSVPGANTFRVATGGAVVDGKPYHNTSDVDVNIPSAVGAGNTRIDRIVLRADWTAQTVRIYRIAGTDAADPEPPAYTKTSQSTYDVLLYQVLVDTSGNVSIELDERELGAIITTDIANAAITTEKINNGAITSAKLQDGAALAEILDDDGAGSGLDADKLDGQEGSYYAPATQGVTGGNSHDHNGGDGAQIPEAGLVTAVQNQLVTNGDNHDHIGGDGATLTTSALQNGAVTEAKLASAVTAQLVTNGDTHNHDGGDGGAIPEAGLATAVQNKLVTNGNSHDHIGGDGAAIGTNAISNDAVTPAKIPNRTRKIFIQGQDGDFGGEPTLEYDEYCGFVMPKNDTYAQVVQAAWMIPEDYVGGLTIRAIAQGRLQNVTINYQVMCWGGAIDEVYNTIWATTSGSKSIIYQKFTEVANIQPTGVAKGDMIFPTFSRTTGGDNADIGFRGFMIEYTADS